MVGLISGAFSSHSEDLHPDFLIYQCTTLKQVKTLNDLLLQSLLRKITVNGNLRKPAFQLVLYNVEVFSDHIMMLIKSASKEKGLLLMLVVFSPWMQSSCAP